MIKRLLLYGVVMAILLAGAFTARQWDKDTMLLDAYASEIGHYLDAREREAFLWVEEQEAAIQSSMAGKPVEGWEAVLRAQASKNFTVLVYHADSIVFWSNTRVIPPYSALPEGLKNGKRAMLWLPKGHYLANGKMLGPDLLVILVPIRFSLNTAYARPFPANEGIESSVLVIPAGANADAYPVQCGGDTICAIDSKASLHAAGYQWLKLFFWALFGMVFLSVAGQIARWLTEKIGVWAGMLVLLLVVGAVALLGGKFAFFAHEFNALPLFGEPFEAASLLGRSVGVWVINTLLWVWFMASFHRLFKMESALMAPFSIRLLLSGIFYVLTMLGVVFCVEAIRRLVYFSRLRFDFDNVLNLDGAGILAITGIFFLILGLFLFGHRLLLTIRRMNLQRKQRLMLLSIASIIYFGVCSMLPLASSASLFLAAAFGIVFAFVFDAYVNWENPGMGWIVIWLLLLSSFCASLLYRYNYFKGKADRRVYAEALAFDRDTAIAEKQLPILYEAFFRDSQNLNTKLRPWPFKATEESLRDHFNSLLFGQNYLFQHYRLNVQAFDPDGQPLLQGQTADFDMAVRQNWEKGKPLEHFPDIRYHTDQAGIFRYMFRLNAYRMHDKSQPAAVYCFFDHQYPQPARVFSRLFYQSPYKHLTDLPLYDFTVIKNGQLVVEHGQGNTAAAQTQLGHGEYKEINRSEPPRVDALFKSADGQTVAAVGKRGGGWYKQLYLFSMLFMLASVFLFLLALANSYFQVLPDFAQFKLSFKGTLAKRIHFGNIMLIAVAFLIIGLMTYRHFKQAYRESERINLDYQADAVLTSLRMQLLSPGAASDTLHKQLAGSLANIAQSLSMDANLYSPDGVLQYTTQSALAGLGLAPARMNPAAWVALSQGLDPERVENEQVAGTPYFAKYLPLRNGQNRLVGFLGIPYQISERRVGAEVSDFIGMLAGLYVFLLLIAYAVTFGLSRSIIKPLTLISEKIKELRLEDKNEPLQYQGDTQDELSELIAQYNRMVDKLEDSKVQMIRLERESAWREMARQVAHDIKNPLTTMKLSMQQLERVSSNPEQAAAYLRKAITRLIEQIDSLAQIASEFSMFANLDIRSKNDVVINEVVESVHDLFSEQKNVSLELKLPETRYHIQGDKNHLIRVFNNLVINAIQAIPSDRDGHIKVSLYRENDLAVIRISDNGGGIPAEIRNRVFEPNFTTKTSGSGLGLAICKKIIEAHDGNIRFETRDNEGTDFFVEVPITATGG